MKKKDMDKALKKSLELAEKDKELQRPLPDLKKDTKLLNKFLTPKLWFLNKVKDNKVKKKTKKKK